MAKRSAPKTAFKKGQSGNPKGRTKGQPNKVTAEIRDLARSILEQPAALAKLREQARTGKLNPIIQKELMHYAYGVPKQRIELGGEVSVLRVVVEA